MSNFNDIDTSSHESAFAVFNNLTLEDRRSIFLAMLDLLTVGEQVSVKSFHDAYQWYLDQVEDEEGDYDVNPDELCITDLCIECLPRCDHSGEFLGDVQFDEYEKDYMAKPDGGWPDEFKDVADLPFYRK